MFHHMRFCYKGDDGLEQLDELKILQNRLESERDINNAIYCTIEEMSEVTKVLTKFLRCSRKFSIDDLTEELAHSFLMLDVIKNRFNIKDEDIRHEKLLALKKCFKDN